MTDLAFDVEKAKDVFFDAMLAGYVDPQHSHIEHTAFPGSKFYEYNDGEWHVTDMWHVAPNSDYSGGTTIIHFMGSPVWMMQYWGHYPERVQSLV